MASKTSSRSKASPRTGTAKRASKSATVSNTPSEPTAKPGETMTVPKDVGEAGMAAKYPSTAPTPVEEAAKLDAKAEVEAAGKQTLSERVDVLEQAVTSGLALDLSQYMPRSK